MKTAQEWLDELAKGYKPKSIADWTPISCMANAQRIAAIQADALAEGERRGRIAGLREAAQWATPDHKRALLLQADRLEKEQEKKSPVDKSNVKE